MSREVRRVPLDWKHPTRPDKYAGFPIPVWGARRPVSRLLKPGEGFVGLMDGYAECYAEWQREVAEMEAKTGHDWTFGVSWHTGKGLGDCTCHPGEVDHAHPVYRCTEDGEREVRVAFATEDELHALLVQRKRDEEPNPEWYLPAWPEGATLGYCLYETVSEGTPTTPVFATPEELVEHLVAFGEDYDQEPYRREAAEALVRTGSSFGTFAMVGGQMLHGARDLDRLMGGVES